MVVVAVSLVFDLGEEGRGRMVATLILLGGGRTRKSGGSSRTSPR